MKLHRRTVGLSLGFVAVSTLAAWLAWDLWPGGGSIPDQTAARSEAAKMPEGEIAAADALDTPQAPTPVDFSGKWQLDAAASESMDAIFTAIGLSILERTLINNSVVTHIITQTADEFTIEVKAAFFSRTDHLPLNGEPAQTLDPTGRPVESVSRWSDDARRLITTIFLKPEQQKFTMTRSLNDERGTMELLIEFVPKEGETLTSRRVYRRIES